MRPTNLDRRIHESRMGVKRKKTLISPQFTSDPFQGLAVREKKKKVKTGENGNVTFC